MAGATMAPDSWGIRECGLADGDEGDALVLLVTRDTGSAWVERGTIIDDELVMMMAVMEGNDDVP